jgi:hypothetical protein
MYGAGGSGLPNASRASALAASSGRSLAARMYTHWWKEGPTATSKKLTRKGCGRRRECSGVAGQGEGGGGVGALPLSSGTVPGLRRRRAPRRRPRPTLSFDASADAASSTRASSPAASASSVTCGSKHGPPRRAACAPISRARRSRSAPGGGSSHSE